jgi:hypothetical protein
MSFGTIGLIPNALSISSINIVMSVYGHTVPTLIVDLCEDSSCPISGRFTGKTHRLCCMLYGLILSVLDQVLGSRTLNQSYNNVFPSIAWSVPDVVRVTSLWGIQLLNKQLEGCYCNLQFY